jgi:hypothetical protein
MATGADDQYWEKQRLPSVFKHDLLGRYLPVFAGKTGSALRKWSIWTAMRVAAVMRTEALPRLNESFRSLRTGAPWRSATASSSMNETETPVPS